MRSILFISLTAMALAGCAASRLAPPPVFISTPQPQRVVPPPAPLSADWNDWPFTPGDWTYRRSDSDSGALAMFGMATMILRCDFAQRTIMLRVGEGGGKADVRTTTMTRSIALDADGRATLAAADPLLDAIAFSRGRFVIERTGQAPIVVAPHGEIGRVIEDCRG